ncbi:MAG: 3-phosphoserine/phosphohydroxythreonine transaminase [Gammaproteobacteria bacterium]|nr:3-phosphoserine/phosphohydroxythreonine transaminase [Gammaproteobacteria bacterium]
MSRVFNFNPGPATLPVPVLQRMRSELLDYGGSGMSIMEMSHRGQVFMEVAAQAETRLRNLLSISDDYAVLFLHGGAQMMFSAVPMNFHGLGQRAGYVVTGSWSDKAVKAAKTVIAGAETIADSTPKFDYAPAQEDWRDWQDMAYIHYTPNETIGGVEFHWVPQTGEVPLVADMSSNILSAPVAVDRFGLIYAGAQKNIGIAGLAIVIVRKDLMGHAHSMTPGVLEFAGQAKAESMLNTPPTFAWYTANLVFGWLQESGGVQEMAQRNQRKAETLYTTIDGSSFYSNPVREQDRSRMNIPFTLPDDALNAPFLAAAQAQGLAGLKGHRAVGGMRASIYNAMPQEGVDALVQFMAEFERTHG